MTKRYLDQKPSAGERSEPGRATARTAGGRQPSTSPPPYSSTSGEAAYAPSSAGSLNQEAEEPEMASSHVSLTARADTQQGEVSGKLWGTKNRNGSSHVPSRARSLYGIVLFLVFMGVYYACYFHTGKQKISNPAPALRDPSREIRVRETSNSISGTYPLYDLLDLSTQSGSISVTVEPRSGNRNAVLRVRAGSGSISIRIDRAHYHGGHDKFQTEKSVSQRTYDTFVEAHSGSIHAELLHGGPGGKTVVNVESGSLDLHVIPVSDHLSTLRTSTRSGTNKVVVSDPLSPSRLANLSASHRSTISGMLDISYPRGWEGRVHALSYGSGQVVVKGTGLRFERQGRDTLASRGHDAARSGKMIEVCSEGSGLINFTA